MNKIRAHLKLYGGINKRKTPFRNGYRPLFKVQGCGLVSGMIDLLDHEEFFPGEEGVVEIRFLNAMTAKGDIIYFYESIEPLGECLALEVLSAGDAK